MRAQRSKHLPPAISGIAEDLPLDDKSVDASMAIMTVHQWSDLNKGLSELNRVARGPVLILTFDPQVFSRFWLADCAPELITNERGRLPAIDIICKGLNRKTKIITIPISADCTDGFAEAYYARPEKFLDVDVRKSQSMWGVVDNQISERVITNLRNDLNSGAWDRKYGNLRKQAFYDSSLRLIIGDPQVV